MNVKVHCFNEGQSGQYYKLIVVEEDGENYVMPYSPTWKTKKGAIRYAEKHGDTVVE